MAFDLKKDDLKRFLAALENRGLVRFDIIFVLLSYPDPFPRVTVSCIAKGNALRRAYPYLLRL
jgi:hypothetical protein